jgi:hypothetical protein
MTILIFEFTAHTEPTHRRRRPATRLYFVATVSLSMLLPAATFSQNAPNQPGTNAVAPALTGIDVTPRATTLHGSRATQRIVAIGTFANGGIAELEQVQFSSSNTAVAVVGPDGVVTPVADGSTEIIATVGQSTARATITVENLSDQLLYFDRDVLPVISKAGCNITGCHGSPKGKKNLKLSLFAAEVGPDFETLSRSSFGMFANRLEPEKSYFLLKATGAISHGGGKRVDPGSADYKLLADWVGQGMPQGDGGPKLAAIEVFPKNMLLDFRGAGFSPSDAAEPTKVGTAKDHTRQLLVTAKYSDGSTRDVTQHATCKSSEESVVIASDAGRVTAVGLGESVIIVGYGGRFVTSRVGVPQRLPTPFPEVAANNKIDELVFAKLGQLGIPPSGVSSDAEFLRRVSLDVIGTLPTPDETRAFLASTDAQKRAKLVDSLLERGEFADFWALKWGDLLRVKPEFPIQLWPKGVATFHRWIRDSMAANKPYDQFVRELVTASGSGYRDGPANYYRATSERNPQGWAEMTATTFLGVRIDCAHCHNHPFETLTWDDNFGLAAFFKVGLKNTGEWGEQIVHYNPGTIVRHVQTGQVVKPKLLGGDSLELTADEDPRVRLANWMTSPENPWFTKCIANRVWYWLMGRGIIHEPDDLRETNPPENPELLDYLCQELVAHKYDLKHLFRLILNSKTYQLSSKPNQWNRTDEMHFSHYPIKRLGAEQLLDAVSAVCESPEKFPGLPAGYRAIQLSHSGVNSFFLDLFGRPPRDISCECERKQEASMPQALYLINTDHLEGKLRGGQRIKRLLAAGKSDAEIVEEFYLAALSRLPTDGEKVKTLEYLSAKKDAREQAFQDVLWALLNTKEFMFSH